MEVYESIYENAMGGTEYDGISNRHRGYLTLSQVETLLNFAADVENSIQNPVILVRSSSSTIWPRCFLPKNDRLL